MPAVFERKLFREEHNIFRESVRRFIAEDLNPREIWARRP